MLEFLKQHDKNVLNVKSISLKDYDDENGAINEHYIVTCDVVELNSSSPSMVNHHVVKDCLVDSAEYNRFAEKKQIIKWI